MSRLATRIVFVFVMACAAGIPAARAQTELLFDYVGFDYEDPNPNPGVFGAVGEGYKGVGEVPVLHLTFLAPDTTTYQYTYFFTDLTVTSRSTIGPFDIINYGPGKLRIYEDSRSTGTAANYGIGPPPNGDAPDSFIDGTLILEGDLNSFQYVFNTDTKTGSFEADFTAVSGSKIGNIPLDQRVGWTFAGTSGNSVTIPPGYAHQVDGQTFLNAPTVTRTGTWGGIKARYR
jgi:hypothetical protein